MAAIFSGAAIPVLSGFLEPSQPPAVAAVQVGNPNEGDAARESKDRKQGRGREGDRRGRAALRARQRPAQAAPSPPASADDGADDDGDAD